MILGREKDEKKCPSFTYENPSVLLTPSDVNSWVMKTNFYPPLLNTYLYASQLQWTVSV